MMNFVRKVAAGVTAMFLSCLAWGGQRDTLLLTVDELFRMGMEMSLVLQADTLDCLMAGQSCGSMSRILAGTKGFFRRNLWPGTSTSR